MSVSIRIIGDGPNCGRWMHAGNILTGRSTVEQVRELFRGQDDFFRDIMRLFAVLVEYNATYAYHYQTLNPDPNERRPLSVFDLEFPTEEDAILFKLVYEP
jgi:hypothetical protein